MIGVPTYAGSYPQMQTGYQQTYRPIYQPMQTNQQPIEPGMVNARYVTCREEAVAAHIIPGDPYIFADFAHGRMYVKQINPQTMASDVVEFVRVQPVQQPVEFPVQPPAQFATQADLDALRTELDSLRTSIAANKTSGRAVTANDE